MFEISKMNSPSSSKVRFLGLVLFSAVKILVTWISSMFLSVFSEAIISAKVLILTSEASHVQHPGQVDGHLPGQVVVT